MDKINENICIIFAILGLCLLFSVPLFLFLEEAHKQGSNSMFLFPISIGVIFLSIAAIKTTNEERENDI